MSDRTGSTVESLWPLFRLRLKTARLELTLAREDEAAALAARAPEDLERDPRWPGAHPEASVGTGVLQGLARALGTWSAEHWRLPLCVWLDGVPVGVQELEGERFGLFRRVETASWLVAEVRGTGIGKEMRAAVLGLAFDHLGAEFAMSGAWEWNAASLGVSRALGYADNGWTLHEHGGRVGVMRNVVLTRDAWDAARYPVTVDGLDACRAWFAAG